MAYISFQPSDYFSTKLYTGTGSSNAITGVGFQPDFTWIKNRDASDFHVMTDNVRGATKYIQSNSTAQEVTDTESLKSFDSDGFTVGTTAQVNTNTEDFVSWNWKAGTTSGIVGSPSITPSAYSINATAGFSIILYAGSGVAGATIPHGLPSTPTCVLTKKRDVGVEAWQWGHDWMNSGTTPWNYDIQLNGGGPDFASLGYWNNTAPSSTLVSFGTGSGSNQTSSLYVAYCFTDIKGYSKFGNYTGNGNADGAFTYTGFRPAFLMVGRTDGIGGDEYLWDTKRNPYNVINLTLAANSTMADYTANEVDILSNGFKIRSTNGEINASGGNFIYLAFAEFPIVSSNDVPGVAR